jgi:hypothetical protein
MLFSDEEEDDIKDKGSATPVAAEGTFKTAVSEFLARELPSKKRKADKLMNELNDLQQE